MLEDWDSYMRFLFLQDVDKFPEVWMTSWKMSLTVLLPFFDAIISLFIYLLTLINVDYKTLAAYALVKIDYLPPPIRPP